MGERFLEPGGWFKPFSNGLRADEESRGFRVEQFVFESAGAGPAGTIQDELLRQDEAVEENRRFNYPIFIPRKTNSGKRVLLLLHGLNERYWDKYLVWAEYLALNTRNPVILFPIAFRRFSLSNARISVTSS